MQRRILVLVRLLRAWAYSQVGAGCDSMGTYPRGHWLSQYAGILLAASLTVAARADVVLDWTELMIGAIQVQDTAPTLSTRNLAILHAAIYDALNSVERTHQPYQFCPDAPPNASAEAAAVGAAREVMQGLYPSASGRTSDLYATYVSSVDGTAAVSNSLAFGARVGRMALQSRADDGATSDVPYIPNSAPGQWRRTPPFFRPPLDPQWRRVKPFCLPAIETFVPPGPPALTSERYAADFNQVRAIGAKNSVARTPEQSQTAVFWSDFSYTAMPPGHWHRIAMVIARDRRNSLSENARLFALLSLAQADAAIVCWEAKYRYNLWRPFTAIQRADEDGNAATEKEAHWTSLIITPNFPEYPSGHSTFSKASANILTRFYGTDAISFIAGSDSLPGVFRRFSSLAACADEVGMSRIYGGIHFMSANLDGKACGGKIADFVAKNYLLPNEELPRVVVEAITNGVRNLRLHGHFGRTCVLESSRTGLDWQPVVTNVTVLGGMSVTVPRGSEGHELFYRVREH